MFVFVIKLLKVIFQIAHTELKHYTKTCICRSTQTVADGTLESDMFEPGSCFFRENFQRLQQDLAQMILACLQHRSQDSVRRKKPLSSQSAEDDNGQESEVDSESGHPEYLHLASVDNTLSTFL